MQATRLGKYLLLDRVNAGGMAEVFRAKHFGVEGFERLIAIKRILYTTQDNQFTEMLIDEARIASQLQHPNVVQIYDLGEVDKQYYIAMEYISGADLGYVQSKLLERERLLPVPAAAYIGSCICAGLEHAHLKCDAKGEPMHLVHRDVSPQNILLGFDGAVKVTDFGIAKAKNSSNRTEPGTLKGKFGYMSPEQVRGKEADRRADIFATGVVLYHMLTGRLPFKGNSNFQVLERVRSMEFEKPRSVNPEIPEEFEAVILKAMAEDPSERYLWASEMRVELQQFRISGKMVFDQMEMSALMEKEFAQELEKERVHLERLREIVEPAADRRGDNQLMKATEPISSPERRAMQERSASTVEERFSDLVSGARKRFFVRALVALFLMGFLGWLAVGMRGNASDEADKYLEADLPPDPGLVVPESSVDPSTVVVQQEKDAPPETLQGKMPEDGVEDDLEEVAERGTVEQDSAEPEFMHPDVAALEKDIEASMKQVGIVDGDAEEVDRRRSKMQDLMLQQRVEESLAEGRQALKLVLDVQINRNLVSRKRKRLQKSAAQLSDKVWRSRMTQELLYINKMISQGKIKKANRHLNRIHRSIQAIQVAKVMH